jgi:hypothetical protein
LKKLFISTNLLKRRVIKEKIEKNHIMLISLYKSILIVLNLLITIKARVVIKNIIIIFLCNNIKSRIWCGKEKIESKKFEIECVKGKTIKAMLYIKSTTWYVKNKIINGSQNFLLFNKFFMAKVYNSTVFLSKKNIKQV